MCIFGLAIMLISVAAYESLRETLDILSDEETLTALRQSCEESAAGDTYTAGEPGGWLVRSSERRGGRFSSDNRVTPLCVATEEFLTRGRDHGPQ
jgi:hypothetical protein